MKQFVSVREAAELYGTSTQSVCKWLRDGLIPAERSNNDRLWIVRREDLPETVTTKRGRTWYLKGCEKG